MKEQIIAILKKYSYHHSEGVGRKSQFRYIAEIYIEDIADDIMKIAEFEELCKPDYAEIHMNDSIFKQNVNNAIAERMPSEEEVLRYFNNHFDCYADADHVEIAMTNTAVLKLIWWFRSRMSNPNNSVEGKE